MPNRSRILGRETLLIVLSCGILLAGCNRDPNVRKQKYYDSAIGYLGKGKPKEAMIQFRNALKIDPNFPEAASALAELLVRQRNYGEAFTLLKRIEENKPDFLPARKGLGQIYRAAGRFEEAEREAEYILDQTPDDIDALLILAAAQAAQKKLADAEGTFNRILEVQPAHVTALLGLASLRKDAEDLPGAERYLKLAHEKNPRSLPVYAALIHFYAVTGRLEEAEALFPEALKVSNNSLEILQLQVDFYIGEKRLLDAERVVKTIQSLHANDPKFWDVLADYYVQLNDWPRAKAELERVLQQHKDHLASTHQLIEVLLNLNNRKGAETLNEAVLNKNPKDAVAHLTKGRLYLAAGDTNNALLQFNQTKKYEPDMPALHFWYAEAYLERGDVEQAKQSLAEALKYKPGFREAREDLANLENQTGAPDAALSNERMLIGKRSGELRAIVVYTQTLILKKDYALAERILKTVAEQFPQAVEAHRQLGDLAQANNNPAAARKEYQEALDLQPDSEPLLNDVLSSYVAQKQTGAAIEFMLKRIQLQPKNASLYQHLAGLYLTQSNRANAITALNKALSLQPDHAPSALMLADLDVQDHKMEQARQLVIPLVQRYSANVAVQIGAGTIFEKLGAWDEARSAYERAVDIDNGNPIAANNLAWVLAEHGGNIDVALGLAQKAKEKMPYDLQVTNTIGWIYYKKKSFQMALNYLKQCADGAPNNATFQYQLGMTYWKLGNRLDARRSFENALKLDPKFPEAESARQALTEL